MTEVKYQKLIDYLQEEHDLLLLESEIYEIELMVDEQVKKEKKIQGIIYKEMLRRKLDEIEKSLPSDEEIESIKDKNHYLIPSVLITEQRNKTQEAINKLKKG